MQKTHSVIDYVRDDLDSDVWAISDKSILLQSNIRGQILGIVYAFLDDMFIPEDKLISVYVYGSILSNQFTTQSDIDCQICINKEYANKEFPGLTGEDLYDILKENLHGLELEGTPHLLNCTIVFEGEVPLGQTPFDPVYDVIKDEIRNDPVLEKDDFDPDKEFSEERDNAAEIAGDLDRLIYEAKEDLVDYALIEEAITDVKDPTKLLKKLEEKLLEIEADIIVLVQSYNLLKDARTEALSADPKNDWEESKHWAPGNVVFKYLERYKYIDLLRGIKRKFKEGLDEAALGDIRVLLNVE